MYDRILWCNEPEHVRVRYFLKFGSSMFGFLGEKLMVALGRLEVGVCRSWYVRFDLNWTIRFGRTTKMSGSVVHQSSHYTTVQYTYVSILRRTRNYVAAMYLCHMCYTAMSTTYIFDYGGDWKSVAIKSLFSQKSENEKEPCTLEISWTKLFLDQIHRKCHGTVWQLQQYCHMCSCCH